MAFRPSDVDYRRRRLHSERSNVSDELETDIEITDVAHGGEGLGRLDDGRVVFVPRAVPGDVVDIDIEERHRDFARGAIERVVEPSEHRVEPACPYFARCGGCQFWHVPYARELEWKTDAAVEAIERSGDVVLPSPTVHEAPSRERYRNRAEFHRRETDEEGWGVGFFESRSDRLVPVSDCLVADERVNRARRALEEALDGAGALDVMIETAGAESCVAIVSSPEGDEDPPRGLFEFADELDSIPSIRGIRWVGGDREWVGGDASVDGGEALAEPPLDEVRVPAGLFRQANSEVNERLVGRVAEIIDTDRTTHLLELFSGLGNFAFALEGRVERLLAVEGDEAAVEMGNTLADFAGLEHVHFLEEDLSEGFVDLEPVEELGWNTVLLDPPRGGAEGVCRELAEFDADRIVYVSCDPPALGRDLDVLAEADWRVERLELFDMFPATAHVEVVAELRRSSAGV